MSLRRAIWRWVEYKLTWLIRGGSRRKVAPCDNHPRLCYNCLKLRRRIAGVPDPQIPIVVGKNRETGQPILWFFPFKLKGRWVVPDRRLRYLLYRIYFSPLRGVKFSIPMWFDDVEF